MMAATLRTELEALKPRHLVARAEEIGIPEGQIDSYDNNRTDERKAALIQLMLDSMEGMEVTTSPNSERWSEILMATGPERQRHLQAVLDRWHNGRWVVDEVELGRGSSGAVFKCSDSRLGQVAIKFSHSEKANKLAREASLMQRVAHPHVCKLYEHHMADEGRLSGMVIELLAKGSLAQRIKKSLDGRLREFEAIQMAFDVLSALEFMHVEKGVIHMDIKPANIVMTELDGRMICKLIDFSISAIELQSRESVSKSLQTGTATLQKEAGTHHYMSPEQFDGDVVASAQTDLWSLGVVLFEALSGKLPFGDGTNDRRKISYAIVNKEPPELLDVVDEVGAVSESISEFTHRALQKDLTQRFSTAAQMTAALNHAITLSPGVAFGLFISYRVWCDDVFAQALYTAASKCELRPGRENRMKVYLDKVRIVDGRRFDENFARGLAASTVFTPLISANCLKGFVELGDTDKEDFVLTEWIMALELMKRGIVKAIFPIMIGEQDTDGKYSQTFFEDLRDGRVSWPASHPEASFSYPAGAGTIPDVVSCKSITLAKKFLGMLKPPVELSEELTVKSVVDKMRVFQAVLLHWLNDSIDSQADMQLVRVDSAHGKRAKAIARRYAAQTCAERIVKIVVATSEPEPEPEPELQPEHDGPMPSVASPSALLEKQMEQLQHDLAKEKERSRKAAEQALLAGQSYQTTRRIDLSEGDIVTEEQIETIASRSPDLEALFLPVGTKLSKSTMISLRRQCPRALCLELGCEIGEKAFTEILQQHRQSKRIDLCDDKFARVTANGLAEIINMCALLEAIFTHSTTKIERQAIAELSIANPSIRCLMLGREISADSYSQLERQLRDVCMLDLSGAEYSRLSDAGINELIRIPGLVDSLEAIFTNPDNHKISENAIIWLKSQCNKCKCALLGREVTMASFLQLQTQATETQRIDLATADFMHVTAKGLAELGDLFPQLVAVFTSWRYTTIGAEDLELIRPSFPAIRCLCLGREITADAYRDLERQLESTQMLDLTTEDFGKVTASGLAELEHMPGIAASLKAIFTSPNKTFAEPLSRLEEICSGIECLRLGQEIGMPTFVNLRASFQATKVVDLSGAAFSRLTTLGLEEIVRLCPDISALAQAATQVQDRPNLNAYLLQKIAILGGSLSEQPFRSCLDRPFVQMEIRYAQQYKKTTITVFEDERRRQAFFDYSAARETYGGGEWERVLNIDSVTYRRDKHEAQAMLSRIVEKMVGPACSPSSSPLNAPGYWDIYLSHAQAAAGDQVKTLYFLLKERGYTVWYDNEMSNRSTPAIEEGVRHSANFLLFLSGDPNPGTGAYTETNTEEGVPPVAVPQDIDSWLTACRLERYGAVIKEYGYDSVEVLCDETEEEIKEMLADPDLGMKKPHARKFLREWQKLTRSV